LRFNNLLHHLTVTLLWEAYDRLKHKAAPGVDGVDWYGYGQNLPTNLVALHERIHTGRYRAQPVKRQWIDKADGRQRPLGVTCLEDKIVQQALVLILQEIYEPEFLGTVWTSGPSNGADARPGGKSTSSATRMMWWPVFSTEAKDSGSGASWLNGWSDSA